MIDDKVEIEGNDVVGYLERVIYLEVMVPCVEDVLILHSKLVVSYLGKTGDVCLTNYSGSEVGLLDGRHKVLLEWICFRWIGDRVNPFLTY